MIFCGSLPQAQVAAIDLKKGLMPFMAKFFRPCFELFILKLKLFSLEILIRYSDRFALYGLAWSCNQSGVGDVSPLEVVFIMINMKNIRLD